MERHLRHLRVEWIIRTVPNGTNGATHAVGWDTLATLAGTDECRQTQVKEPAEYRHQMSSEHPKAGLLRAGEQEVNNVRNDLSEVEIETRAKSLRRIVRSAGVRTNPRVDKAIRTYAAKSNLNEQLWEDTADACACAFAGDRATGWIYFVKTYENKVADATAAGDAEETVAKSEEAEPSDVEQRIMLTAVTTQREHEVADSQPEAGDAQGGAA